MFNTLFLSPWDMFAHQAFPFATATAAAAVPNTDSFLAPPGNTITLDSTLNLTPGGSSSPSLPVRNGNRPKVQQPSNAASMLFGGGGGGLLGSQQAGNNLASNLFGTPSKVESTASSFFNNAMKSSSPADSDNEFGFPDEAQSSQQQNQMQPQSLPPSNLGQVPQQNSNGGFAVFYFVNASRCSCSRVLLSSLSLSLSFFFSLPLSL